jgi:hypothetical protein
MKKGLLGILAVGMMATAADAATLSMRFVGGGNEATMGVSDSATIEVLITMGVNDGPKSPSRLTGADLRFDVGSTADAGFGPYVVADSGNGGNGKFSVTGATAFPGWSTAATSGVGGPFNGDFFLSGGDPAGVAGPTGTAPGSFVILTFTIHKDFFAEGDTYIVFRNGAALPALSNGGAAWTNRFGYDTEVARNQFLQGQGSSGDAGPQYAYHGYETFEPLIIHNIPEPSALALLALGGFAALRRRK